MSLLAPQLSFKDENMRVPRYRIAKIPLNNLSSSQVNLSTSSTTLLEWKIPANSVINLARSYLSYQLVVPALAGNNSVLHENGCPARDVYFGNASGVGIVDLKNADVFVEATRPLKTNLSDFLSQDQISGHFPSRQAVTSNVLPFSRDGLTAGTQIASSVDQLEQQYLSITANANTAVTWTKLLPLSNFKDTFLAMDKDVAFGSDMYLRLFWNSQERLYYYTSTPNQPQSNVTLPTIATTLNNVFLYLSIEENRDISNSIMEALRSGSIRMKIPYPFSYRFSTSGASTSASFSFTLTKNYGSVLKRLQIVPYNGYEKGNQSYNHANVNGTKITSFSVSVDGRPQSDAQITCYNPNSTIVPTGTVAPSNVFCEDYREMLPYLHSSCVLSYPMFQSNWQYLQSWGEQLNDAKLDGLEDARIPDGLDLKNAGDRVIAFTANCPAIAQATNENNANGLIMYAMCLFQRDLMIAPDGILVQ